MVTHIVSFKLRDPSPEILSETQAKLLSMQSHIPQLRYLETGEDALHTSRSFDLVLITRFDTWDGYHGYQNHDYHQNEVLPYMHSVIEKSIVVDYESELTS
jgi:hypothetical protein